MLAVDGYRYGAKAVDRRAEVDQVRAALPSLRACVWLPYLDPDAPAPDGAVTWTDLLAGAPEAAPLEHEPLPFDHPLYVLYSSGTTGLPKPIVHGHGGIVLEHLKQLSLQLDLGPTDRFFWFSTTGWMMWNLLVSGIGVGATVVLFDGDPGHPDLGTLWRLAEDTGTTFFGTSAPFLLACRKAGIRPAEVADLSTLRAVGSTGAPLPPDGFRWVADELGHHVAVNSLSGGTDVCTAFVGGVSVLPVRAGEMAARYLGCAVEAWDEQGRPVVDEVGELVLTRPMPSMPVGFWGDPDGSRYREAYFEHFPGVWRHGDWVTVTSRGSCVIHGRSDATLNRGGVRLGTAEFYAVVEELPEVADSLVVHLEDPEGGPGELVLFVVPAPGVRWDDEVEQALRRTLRDRLSPRHVPDAIHAVAGVPRTLSGKKLEVPAKRILQGAPVERAAAAGALANPETLDEFVRIAADRAGQ
jgi:acetoacetyl-CoA synthetase